MILPLVALGCRTVDHRAEDPRRWWKGNLHTHTLWSDGDGYPDMVADWYRSAGYHFVALTDHDVVPRDPDRWVAVDATEGGRPAYRRYLQRFGHERVDDRMRGDTLVVRLRTIDEVAALLGEPELFLVLTGEEITDAHEGAPVHLTVTNLISTIAPIGGESVADVVRRAVVSVAAQSRHARRPMIAHLNHPNYEWAVSARDLRDVPGLGFFEVYNGHPLVNNAGDGERPSTDRIWDEVLTWRLERGAGPVYGLATDDAHDYHVLGPAERNPGRGWIVARAATLTPSAILAALESGEFYASTGVELENLGLAGDRLMIRIRQAPGVSYTTRFIGTRRGGAPDEVGAILAEARGPRPSYRWSGDELYVRAKIVSDRRKPNAPTPDEVEVAWTQPFVRSSASAAPFERITSE